MGLPELQSYCDERARRHAEAVARGWPGPAREVHRARMEEAMEIGRYVAAILSEARGK